jgi:hypothetical protein
MPEPPRRPRRAAPRFAPRAYVRPRAAIDSSDVDGALDGPFAFLGDPEQFLPRFILSLALQPPRALRRRPR